MGGSNENFPGVIRPSNIQGMGNNRRALSTIDTNIIQVHKRVDLIEENACSSKHHFPLAHCSDVRKFAAELAVKEQPSLQEVKPSIHSFPSTIDVEGYDPIDDNVVPMFVQHTEAMLEEIDQMDVEDMDEDELVVNIDGCDKRNPLAVSEYIDDIYAYYKKIESSSHIQPNYMVNQSDINERMRGILIDWLIEVHHKFDLMDETLYLTVNLIDRFLATQAVVRDKLQLVGATALLIASKYEEVSVPAVDDLVLISDSAYCRKDVLDMERLMINTLQFNLSVATPYAFIRCFIRAARFNKRLEMLSLFIVELCLVEYGMLKFPPSLLAAAAVYTAQCTLTGHKRWSWANESYTCYSEGQLMECVALMVALHRRAATGRLTSVYRKYGTAKYGYAARTCPAVFLAGPAAF